MKTTLLCLFLLCGPVASAEPSVEFHIARRDAALQKMAALIGETSDRASLTRAVRELFPVGLSRAGAEEKMFSLLLARPTDIRCDVSFSSSALILKTDGVSDADGSVSAWLVLGFDGTQRVHNVNISLVEAVSEPIQAAQKPAIPFFVDGWERILEGQFETVVDSDADAAEISASSFWRSYSPEQIMEEAMAFLALLSRSGSFAMLDPTEMDFTVSAIRFERLGYVARDDGRSWYLVVQLSGWGKEQRSGVPIALQIVMIPGRGFKTPTPRREPIQFTRDNSGPD